MAADATDPLVGSMLGKDYRVLEPIGMGGMAVVYLVQHQTLLKQFAAKVLSPALASSLEARARFTQEAHAASQLDHDNIVSITDFGVTVDHRPFFVMELLRGQTLDQRLTEGPMTIEEVVAVGVPVARALAHAHAEGIVHLDVKPENIFLVQRSQGRWGVKVVDFGIAKTPQSPGVTEIGQTAGSPQFMAPEVCRGDEDIDQRADVYSFGILLYRMLCGRLPFVDDSVDRVLEMQLVQLPPPPRELNAALTPELAAIIERTLAKRPADRYPSMDALMHDLEAALPPGSDRMLIEAASGVTMSGTPFAGALSGMDSMRMARQSQPQPLVLPVAPARRRWPIALGAALAAAAGAAVLWSQLAKPSAPATQRVAQARALTPLPARADGSHGDPAAPATPSPAHDSEAAAQQPDGDTARRDGDTARPDGDTARQDGELAGQGEPAPSGGESAVPQGTAPRVAPPGRVAAATLVDPRRPGARPIPRREPIGPARRTPLSATGSASTGTSPPSTAGSPPATDGSSPSAVGSPPSTVSSPPSTAAPSAEPVETIVAVAPTPTTERAPDPPLALPPPAPPVQLKPPPPPRGSLDAAPAVVSLDVKGSLSPSIVRRSVDRTLASLRTCYRTAARAGGTTPALELRLAFEIDENGLATHVATSGASFGSLASCAAGVAGQIRTQEAPDVGTVQVSAVIGFRPS